MPNKELILQTQISAYIRTQYPRVLFNSDLSGIRLTIGQAKQVKNLRSGRGWPDLFIAEPCGDYAGLFLELKTSEDEVYTKTGQYRQNKHIIEQREMLSQLTRRGYMAQFACGFEQAKRMIDNYLAQEESAVTLSDWNEIRPGDFFGFVSNLKGVGIAKRGGRVYIDIMAHKVALMTPDDWAEVQEAVRVLLVEDE